MATSGGCGIRRGVWGVLRPPSGLTQSNSTSSKLETHYSVRFENMFLSSEPCTLLLLLAITSLSGSLRGGHGLVTRLLRAKSLRPPFVSFFDFRWHILAQLAFCVVLLAVAPTRQSAKVGPALVPRLTQEGEGDEREQSWM